MLVLYWRELHDQDKRLLFSYVSCHPERALEIGIRQGDQAEHGEAYPTVDGSSVEVVAAHAISIDSNIVPESQAANAAHWEMTKFAGAMQLPDGIHNDRQHTSVDDRIDACIGSIIRLLGQKIRWNRFRLLEVHITHSCVQSASMIGAVAPIRLVLEERNEEGVYREIETLLTVFIAGRNRA
jgi:hypothetical protein